jgi:hypothetical protein
MQSSEIQRSMKEKLKALYTDRQNVFISVATSFPDDDLAGPFLMAPSEKYTSQTKQLLIIGQETAGWNYHVHDIDKQMQHYDQFNLGIEYYASPFWNITRKLERALKIDEYSCAWTNINKFDLDGGRPYGKYVQAISTLDNILIDEIKILNPTMCMFFTGPSFDERVKCIYEGIQFKNIENWPNRQLCQLVHPLLPENTFRSYHPKALRIRHLEENFINFISSINIP